MPSNLALLTPKKVEPASSFMWATVTQATPLRIRIDGDTNPLGITPDSLVADLVVNDRVWVQVVNRRLVVIGRSETPTQSTWISTTGAANGGTWSSTIGNAGTSQLWLRRQGDFVIATGQIYPGSTIHTGDLLTNIPSAFRPMVDFNSDMIGVTGDGQPNVRLIIRSNGSLGFYKYGNPVARGPQNVNVTIPSGSASGTANLTFSQPFSAVPGVTLNVHNGTVWCAWAGSITNTGCTITLRHYENVTQTSAVTVGVQAMATGNAPSDYGTSYFTFNFVYPLGSFPSN